MQRPPPRIINSVGFGVMRPRWVVLISESGNRARPINTRPHRRGSPRVFETTPWVAAKSSGRAKNIYEGKEVKAPSKPLTALMGAAEVEYNNNNNNNNIPSLVQFAEGWSVPVNISAHAGRVRASLSARPLHADTIRIAVCVPESRRLLSNTRAGESRTERRDWGRPAPSGHRALIAKLFFFSLLHF